MPRRHPLLPGRAHRRRGGARGARERTAGGGGRRRLDRRLGRSGRGGGRDGAAPSGQPRQGRGAGDGVRVRRAERRERGADHGRRRAARSRPRSTRWSRRTRASRRRWSSACAASRPRTCRDAAASAIASRPGGSRASPGALYATRSRGFASIRARSSRRAAALDAASTPRPSCSCARRKMQLPLVEVPIKTIYAADHVTHFHGFRDTLRVIKLVFFSPLWALLVHAAAGAHAPAAAVGDVTRRRRRAWKTMRSEQKVTIDVGGQKRSLRRDPGGRAARALSPARARAGGDHAVRRGLRRRQGARDRGDQDPNASALGKIVQSMAGDLTAAYDLEPRPAERVTSRDGDVTVIVGRPSGSCARRRSRSTSTTGQATTKCTSTWPARSATWRWIPPYGQLRKAQ